MTIHVVQPALPAYRIPFFKAVQAELSKRGEALRVYASRRDHLNVESVASSGFEAELHFDMSVHLRSSVFWQKGLDVPLVRGDVLVINGNPRMLSNYPLWVRAKSLGVPTIWWGHGWSAGSRGRRSRFRHRIMRFADALILYTDKERDDYIGLGFAPDRTFGLNNGMDVGFVDRIIAGWGPARVGEFRRAKGLDACANWCIFAGRLTAKSDVGLLIESLPGVRQDVGFIILGDGPMAGAARVSAERLGVSARIVWAGAEFDESLIAPWMLAANAFVYPGAIGLSLIHGFAYGLPAVVHGDAERHMPEFAAFQNQVNGLAFERGSAASLASKINEIFFDAARRETMARQASELVHRTFNIEDMCRRFMQAVDRMSPRSAH